MNENIWETIDVMFVQNYIRLQKNSDPSFLFSYFKAYVQKHKFDFR